MSDSAKSLNHFIDKARHLYSLPAVALEILELTSQPQVDIHALGHCIENDPALTSKILRVVNSSLFGMSSEVSNLQQAIALLGLKPLKLLVLGFSLAETKCFNLTGEVMNRYWRYTLTKAIAAREISQCVWRLPGDEPFIAALLQDLGMLVLIQELGHPYTKFLDKVLDSRGDVGQMEVDTLGFDHTLLTARMLERWGLPKSLCEAVIAGRRPGELYDLSPTHRTLSQIVHLAKLLSDLVVDGRQDVLPQLLTSGAADHQLSASQLVGLVCDLQKKVDQLADIFSLELPTGLNYRDILAQAQSQLADVAEDFVLRLPNGKRHPLAEEEAVWQEVNELSSAVSQFFSAPTSEAALETNRIANPPQVANGAGFRATIASPYRQPAPPRPACRLITWESSMPSCYSDCLNRCRSVARTTPN